MPTYFARGVSVRLGAMPLEDTTTQKIILRKGDAAKQQSQLAEKRLLKSKLLKEKQVPFPGDEAAFQLNWVANAPFMQTRVGSNVHEEEDTRDEEEATTGTHLAQILDSITPANYNFADASSHRKPKALSLHVNLSDKTYVSGLYNQRTSLKVDVFFNGTLSACLFIPTHDIRSGAKSNHQIFAGTRIDFLAERPWVILPPEVAADGSARKNNTPASIEQRWQHLCQALQNEARERGTDEEGNRPPTAGFLNALAMTQMPEQVHSMQKPGGKAFGIIDVVVTAGEGRKLTSGVGYLKAPKRMIDESYPFVFGADDTTVHLRSDAPGKSESEAGPRNVIEPNSWVIDVDAEGNSNPQYGFQTKRQVLQSSVRSTQGASPVLSSALQHPAMVPLIPSIPPPVQIGSRISALVAPSMTGLGFISSAMQRSANPTDLQYPPEIGRAHAQVRAYEPQVNAMSQAGFAPKIMCPNLLPHLQTPQMYPSPYAVQFSDPILEGVAPSDLMCQIPFDNASPTSSPLDHLPVAVQNPNYQPAVSFPSPIPGLRHDPSKLGLYAYSSPNQARGGLSDTHYPRRNYNLSGMGPPVPGAPEFYKPNMLPQAPALLGPYDSKPQLVPFSPFDRRLSLPLPPAALYSVPTKPKRSLSPQKASSSQELKKAKSSIEVKRLVVHGQKDSILVDHRWDPTQRIDVPIRRPAKLRTQEVVASGDNKYANPAEQVKTFTDFRWSRKSTVRMGTPPPTSSPNVERTGPSIVADKQQPIGACQTDVLTDPSTSIAKDTNRTDIAERVGKAKPDDDQPGTDTSNQNLRVTKQRPSRRTTPGNNILGVQGPKANPFWFEDPEEILREASSRLRRSRSVVKQGNTSDMILPPYTVVPAVQTPKVWGTGTPSPLSSLHTTPEPEIEPTSYTHSFQAPIKPSPAPIPQADGSPERKTFHKPRRGNQTPSPVKLASTLTTPQLPRNAPSTPQTSSTKKRKTLRRTLPKEPRSPTRLKTNDNPPLNRDCVIAYAESKDKKNKQGVLRQVKSERLGVFTESDVVFAARFFVEE
jgi:hypothetical protein